MNSSLLCIMGPTASGKTDLAIAVAQRLGGELISVDSALVYRGLDIGSAKPTYPHHLIDICEPDESYSAARFVEDARQVIEAVQARGRRPILVGGTALYYHALLTGLAKMPAADQGVRDEIEAMAALSGWPAVHAALASVDPESAARIHPNHSQRLSRALEVYRLSGKTMTELHARGNAQPKEGLSAQAIAIAPLDRKVLHKRIETRFDAMMAAGFLEEVRGLWGRDDLHADLPAIRAVGYRQLWAHLDGDYALEDARERAIVATRQLAKRQFTWLRKWPDLQWIHTDERGAVIQTDLAINDTNTSPIDDPANLLLNYLTYNPM